LIRGYAKRIPEWKGKPKAFRLDLLTNVSHTGAMALRNKNRLDRVDLAILTELQADARISISELARRVGRSAPAVAERVRKLEEAGVIEGYRAQINPAALGFSVIALIELTTTPAHYDEVNRYAARTPEVQECHFVTGGASFIVRVVARSIDNLRRIIEELSVYGSTRTSVALASPIIKTRFDLEALVRSDG